jgi:hypothetical protein
MLHAWIVGCAVDHPKADYVVPKTKGVDAS